MSRSLRVIVVDDHSTLRQSLKELLLSLPGVEVVGEAATGREALVAADREQPDLVLMDVVMPDMGGLEAVRRLSARPEAPMLILMSMHNVPGYRAAALRAGARHFVILADAEAVGARKLRHCLRLV